MPLDRAGIATDAFAITPSDATTQKCQAIYTGTGGAIAVKTEDGTTVTFTGTTAGSILPVKTLQILATGTTATSIVGFR